MADYTSTHGARSTWCNLFESTHGARTTGTEAHLSTHGVQALQGDYYSTHGVRAESSSSYVSTHGPRSRYYPREFAEIFFPPAQGGVVAKILQKPPYANRLTLYSGDGTDPKDLTGFLEDLKLEENRNTPARWTAVLRDPERRFSPKNRASEFYRMLDGRNYDASFNLRRWLELETKIGGETFYSPWLLCKRNVWDFRPTGATTTISGTDLSDLMQGANLNLPDYFNISLRAAVALVLEACGIHNYRLTFRDSTLPRFTPKGRKGLDYLNNLMRKAQAEWFWERNVFVAQDRVINPAGADWHCVDDLHVTLAQYVTDPSNLTNEQHISKLVANADQLLDPPYVCEGGECIRIHEVPLDYPASVATLDVIEVVNGSVKHPVWKDAEGAVLGQGPTGFAIGRRAIASVQFDYEPQIIATGPMTDAGPGSNLQPWTPRVVIDVNGQIWDPDPAVDPNEDPEFDVTIPDTASQAEYGRRPNPSPMEDQGIKDGAEAEWIGRRLNEESARQVCTARIDGPDHPDVRPSRVILVDLKYGGIESVNFHAERSSKTYTATSARMSVGLSEYPGQWGPPL